jgi:hypothetical protein
MADSPLSISEVNRENLPYFRPFGALFSATNFFLNSANWLFFPFPSVHASGLLLHANVTAHPTAAWTLQQLREAIPSDHGYRVLIHDRDSIFSRSLDQSIQNLGLQVVKTPPRTPQANGLCERAIGSLRRGCLDFLMPLGENHLRRHLKAWRTHYNESRPHMALGPGFPDPPASLPVTPQPHRHRLPADVRLTARPVLGGVHHDYRLEKIAA